MPDLGLRPADRRRIEEILERHVPELEVWAFGSRATGRARPQSDLDLALVTETPLEPRRYLGLLAAISAAELDVAVDVVDLAAVEEAFRERIRGARVGFRRAGGGVAGQQQ